MEYSNHFDILVSQPEKHDMTTGTDWAAIFKKLSSFFGQGTWGINTDGIKHLLKSSQVFLKLIQAPVLHGESENAFNIFGGRWR